MGTRLNPPSDVNAVTVFPLNCFISLSDHQEKEQKKQQQMMIRAIESQRKQEVR